VAADRQLRARRRAEHIRASRAKKTPYRRDPKGTEELAELRGDSDAGRQLK
jgi:hypothetical protein